MEESTKNRKVKRKKNKTNVDTDVETVTKPEGDNSLDKEENINLGSTATWMETENTEKNLKKKKRETNIEQKENSNTISETDVDTVDDIKVEKDEGNEENMGKEDILPQKTGFKFKLKHLNPLKNKKKDKENTKDDGSKEESKKKDTETENINTEEDQKSKKLNDKKTQNEKSNNEAPVKRKMATIKTSSTEREDGLDEMEKSEAENTLHELPSVSSVDEMRELGKKLSAKEKLKQKLDKKKSCEREPGRLLRHLSSQSSRVEDRLKEEDQEAQLAWERHETVMRPRREQQQSCGPTHQQAYHFFTATWEDSTEKNKRNDEDEVDNDEDENDYETAEEEGEAVKTDKKKLLARDFIGSEYEWELTEWAGPDLVPASLRLENERQAYFNPSGVAAGVAVGKAAPGPAEEGLHCGRHPAIHPINAARLEARLEREGRTAAWKAGGPGGEMRGRPHPVSRARLRPCLDPEPGQAEPLTVFVPAVPAEAEQNLISSLALQVGTGKGCQLELDIASLVFSHHHLFSLEHFQTRRLMELYQVHNMII